MSGVMEARMDGGKEAALGRVEASPAGRRETRWSARRKEEVVLRLLRGESATRREAIATRIKGHLEDAG